MKTIKIRQERLDAIITYIDKATDVFPDITEEILSPEEQDNLFEGWSDLVEQQ